MLEKNEKMPITGDVDVILIGAGIMSATLGSILHTLEPGWTMNLYERLDLPAVESSNPWNNAGTGHSALCELNYTPELRNGEIDITKAIDINERFQVSRQYWSHAVKTGLLGDPTEWINPVPHMSFVHGRGHTDFLRKRYEALICNPLFQGTEYSRSIEDFRRWLPLMSEGRDFSEPIALNRNEQGTDIDFGALTVQLLENLRRDGIHLDYGHEIRDLTQDTDGRWLVTIKNRHTLSTRIMRSRFIFVGAGGGALPLLQKSGIKEVKGMAGFPVSGQFLRCLSREVTMEHNAKVYGNASVGAPPMSVPHLDTRMIAGRQGLLFGPYAGWTPKFLKAGTNLDLFRTIRLDNLAAFIGVGLTEMPLTKYLVTQLLQKPDQRLTSLKEFAPTAKLHEWELIWAGQRVQVIRPSKTRGGVLELGTTTIASEDGTIAGLLGASPGASTCVSAMLEILESCFGQYNTTWQPKLREMIPSLGNKLSENPRLFEEVWDYSQKALKLDR